MTVQAGAPCKGQACWTEPGLQAARHTDLPAPARSVNATVRGALYSGKEFLIPARKRSSVKILLISFHFPPDAPIAATRAPKFARYLIEAGHDVRVLCARDPQAHIAHALEIDEDRVVRTDWRDLRAIPGEVLNRIVPARADASGASADPASVVPAPPPRSRLRARLSETYDSAVCRPDRQVGWRPYAVKAARVLFESWTPDLVYATCPPHSVAPITVEIAKLAKAPFVVEFRDRWALDAYSDRPEWRQRLDRRQEAGVLADAAGIVTVSPVWAETYAARYGADRIAVAMNGFDPADYPLEMDVQPAVGRDRIELLFAGALYPGRRDPRAIFQAIALLGEDAKRVGVTMLGKDLGPALAMAGEAGVEDCLTLLPPEPHAAIVRRQYAADALLMLQWNDERDAGTVPGKVFECIGARRPVIATGWTTGVVGKMIMRRNLGVIANEPRLLANKISALLSEKRAHGTIAPLPAGVRDGLTRREQFSSLDPFLARAAGVSAARIAAE